MKTVTPHIPYDTGRVMGNNEQMGGSPAARPAGRPRCRRRKAPRCGICGLHLRLCVCAELPRIALPFRIVLVQHGVEVDRPTNTGRLALRMLSNHALVIYGRRGVALETAPLQDEAFEHRLLFPRAGATELSAADFRPREGRPLSLAVADGTWAQASHMTRRIALLRQMPCVRLPPGPPGLWTIRRPRRPDQLCTLEAITRVVAVAGYPEEAAAMQAALAMVHERMLRMRAGAGGAPPAR